MLQCPALLKAAADGGWTAINVAIVTPCSSRRRVLCVRPLLKCSKLIFLWGSPPLLFSYMIVLYFIYKTSSTTLPHSDFSKTKVKQRPRAETHLVLLSFSTFGFPFVLQSQGCLLGYFTFQVNFLVENEGFWANETRGLISALTEAAARTAAASPADQGRREAALENISTNHSERVFWSGRCRSH